MHLTRFWSGMCHLSFKNKPIPYGKFSKSISNLTQIFDKGYLIIPKSRKLMRFLIYQHGGNWQLSNDPEESQTQLPPPQKVIHKQAIALGSKFPLHKHSEGSFDVKPTHLTKTCYSLNELRASSTNKVGETKPEKIAKSHPDLHLK